MHHYRGLDCSSRPKLAIVFRSKNRSRSARFFLLLRFFSRFVEELPAPSPAPELIIMSVAISIFRSGIDVA
jgi:hypothetical protein